MKITKIVICILLSVMMILNVVSCSNDEKNITFKPDDSIDTPYTLAEDNYYGMSFNLTVEDFCHRFYHYYYANAKIVNDYYGQNILDTSKMYDNLIPDNFEKMDEVNEITGYEIYQFSIGDFGAEKGYSIFLMKNPGSQYIGEIRLSFFNSMWQDDMWSKIISNVLVPSLIQTVNPALSNQEADSLISDDPIYDKINSIAYQTSVSSDNICSLFIIAITEDKFNEISTDKLLNMSSMKYELLLKTTDVKCEHRNSGFYNFLHKSGDYIFYLTMSEYSCLMSLNINTGETKQIAYVDVDANNPIQCSSDKLTFNGSESGYNMQLLQYDIASEKLSVADKESNTMFEEETLYEELTDIFRANVDKELHIYGDNVFRTDNDLYIFLDEYGVYKLDENNKPIQLSQYPADRYLIYKTEQKIICQDNIIYYRAAAPHKDLIIKLDNGKETVIKTADELQSQRINFKGSLISNTLAIHNDKVWYELNDERYYYDADGNKLKYYVNYIASVDENGYIQNIFNVGNGDLIAFDEEYIYCYGDMNQEAAVENDADPIYSFFRVKIDDTKAN